jgi:hypothetical protein
MKILFIPFISILLWTTAFAQKSVEDDIEGAIQNAKKGIYWALSNLPESKSRMENDLIAEDKLYANVKLYKEVNGFKIISRGFYKSNEVEIVIYRSNDSLLKDGYLKPPEKKE